MSWGKRNGLWRPDLARRLWRETDGGIFGVCQSCCCTILDDDFDRADSATIDNGWNEVSGTWDISSNHLVTSSTSAKCLNDGLNLQYEVLYQTRAQGATNDVIRLYFCYEDSSNYWCAQIQIGTSKQLQVIQSVAGSETVIGSATLNTSSGTPYYLRACVTSFSTISVQLYTGDLSSLLAQTFAAPTSLAFGKAGVGTGGTAADVRFDLFEALRVSDGCEQCRGDCGKCDVASSMPLAWDVTLPNLSGPPAFPGTNRCNATQCAALAGQTVRCRILSVGPSTCQWFGQDTSQGCTLSVVVRFPGPSPLGPITKMGIEVVTVKYYYLNIPTESIDCTQGYTMDASTTSPGVQMCTTTTGFPSMVPVF